MFAIEAEIPVLVANRPSASQNDPQQNSYGILARLTMTATASRSLLDDSAKSPVKTLPASVRESAFSAQIQTATRVMALLELRVPSDDILKSKGGSEHPARKCAGLHRTQAYWRAHRPQEGLLRGRGCGEVALAC